MKVGVVTAYGDRFLLVRKELSAFLTENSEELIIYGTEHKADFKAAGYYNKVIYKQLPVSRRQLSIRKEIVGILFLYKQLKQKQIEVLLVYGVRMIPFVSIAARLARVRTVFVINGCGALFHDERMKNIRKVLTPLIRQALRRADRVLFQNESDLAIFKHYRMIGKNHSIINGSGVNLVEYDIHPLPEENIFLYTGRLVSEKGINELTEAARILRESGYKFNIILAGAQDPDDTYIDRNALNRETVAGSIQLIGETHDVKSCLKQCRYFIFPSYHEGTPRSILEALAIGRPIITTDTAGCRDTTTHKYNGLLVPARNAKALADAMIWMMEHPEEVSIMAHNSRIVAERKYDINDVNATIVSSMRITVI